MGAGLAEGLLSRLLVVVPPVMEVTTDAVSSSGSAAAAALEEDEEEEESRPAVKAPCLSEGEEGEEAGEEAEEEEGEEEEGEEVEASAGALSSGSRRDTTSVSSLALMEAGLGLGLGLGVGVGEGMEAGTAVGTGAGEGSGSKEAHSVGSSRQDSACSTTSPWTTVLSDIGEPTETAGVSSEALASACSGDWRVGVGALQRVRRALRRRSALVRLLMRPSLLRRPTLRLLGVPAATTATSLSSTLAATSLASLMVSFRDSSLVRPDLWGKQHSSVQRSVPLTLNMFTCSPVTH